MQIQRRLLGGILQGQYKNTSVLIWLPAGAFQECPREPAISPTAEWSPGASLGTGLALERQHPLIPVTSKDTAGTHRTTDPPPSRGPVARWLCIVMLQWAVAGQQLHRAAAAWHHYASFSWRLNLLQQWAQQLELQAVPAALHLLRYRSTLLGPWQCKFDDCSSSPSSVCYSLCFFSLCPEARQFVEPSWFPAQHSHCLSVLSCTALLSRSWIMDCKIVWSWWCDRMVVDENTEMHPFLPVCVKARFDLLTAQMRSRELWVCTSVACSCFQTSPLD